MTAALPPSVVLIVDDTPDNLALLSGGTTRSLTATAGPSSSPTTAGHCGPHHKADDSGANATTDDEPDLSHTQPDRVNAATGDP